MKANHLLETLGTTINDMEPLKTQKTLLGYTANEIRAKAQMMKCLDGEVRLSFSARTAGCTTRIYCILSDDGSSIVLRSGLKTVEVVG